MKVSNILPPVDQQWSTSGRGKSLDLCAAALLGWREPLVSSVLVSAPFPSSMGRQDSSPSLVVAPPSMSISSSSLGGGFLISRGYSHCCGRCRRDSWFPVDATLRTVPLARPSLPMTSEKVSKIPEDCLCHALTRHLLAPQIRCAGVRGCSKACM